MKLPIIAGAMVLAFVAEGAMAACSAPGTQVRDTGANTDLTDLLTGNTVCVGSSPVWTAQEEHRAGGDLYDYKLGASDPVDPTKKLGTWATTGNGNNSIVTYTYDTFGTAVSYSFKVYEANAAAGTYDFCGVAANDVEGATVKPGLGPCLP